MNGENKMKEISYVVWKEGRYFVAQCLNIDVSSFGKTIGEASKNIKEAVELYLETKGTKLPVVDNVYLGKERINV